MSQSPVPTNQLSLPARVCWIIFFTSFVCSFRAVTSICTGLLVVITLWENRHDLVGLQQRLFRHPFLIGCLLYFILQFIALLYTNNPHEGWNNIRMKTELLFLPFSVCAAIPLNPLIRKGLFAWYCLILGSVCTYCIIANAITYQQWHLAGIFYYHALVKPVHQHAVYFSIFVFVALAFLLEQAKQSIFLFNSFIHISLTVFFTVFLFFLSSKLVIAFYILYLLYYFISLLKARTQSRVIVGSLFILLVITGTAVLVMKNPVSDRYYEIIHGDINLVNHDKFDRGDYFNGLQFRILQWRFTAGILQENHRWWMGMSPGDAQFYLDQEYIHRNMYIGDPAKGSHGFLGYNTHNEFLQSLLQTGIIGLAIFVFITGSLLYMAWTSRDPLHIAVVVLLVAYSLSESVFQTQYGILLYTFFPLFTWTGRPDKSTPA